MRTKILTQAFFDRKTRVVAKDLLGKYLVRRIGRRTLALPITELEAYVGPHDLASHASKGRTVRTQPMFGKAGTLYVYLVYGMHWMLNVVTEAEGYPAAILIRGTRSLGGPGILTKGLKIDKALNGRPANRRSGLWFEDRGDRVLPRDVKRTPRIGIDYAGPLWSKKRLRFVLRPSRSEGGRSRT